MFSRLKSRIAEKYYWDRGIYSEQSSLFVYLKKCKIIALFKGGAADVDLKDWTKAPTLNPHLQHLRSDRSCKVKKEDFTFLVVLPLFVFWLMGLQPKSFLLGSVLVALMAPWVKVTQMIVVVRAGDHMRPNFDYCGQSSWSLGKNSSLEFPGWGRVLIIRRSRGECTHGQTESECT